MGRDAGGYGLDAQWSDDFHHALHTVLTGETAGYYEDFGSLGQSRHRVATGICLHRTVLAAIVIAGTGDRCPHDSRRTPAARVCARPRPGRQPCTR